MKSIKLSRCVGVSLLVLVLSACGGGSGTTSSGPAPVGGSGSGSVGSTTSSGTSSTTTTTTTSTAEGSISLALSSQQVSSGIPIVVTATLKDAAGLSIPGAVVSFSTDKTIGVFTPSSGTALTDASGRAIIQLSAASPTAAGAATVDVSGVIGTKTYTTSRGYSVGAASVSLSTPGFGANPLSAFGNTSVAVTATSNGAPLSGQIVTFSSPCAAAGKALLTSSVVTQSDGTAQATYQDKGCGTADTVTASASGLASSSATLSVIAPTVGSIQFVSASPASITLQGTGGSGLQETSTVTFKVVDAAGSPLGGKDVTFALNTTVGGIALSAGSAKSDQTTGTVSVIVSAGTVATPVRVTATTAGPSGTILVTQSDQLVISTGVADDDSFSLSAATLNMEAGDYDGVQTKLTVRLADHFNNPVPNGTSVSFIAEGGNVQSSCQTTAGACEVTLTSQNPRPANGRITVLAYAVGEESFTDLDGDGKADTGEYANVGEAFRDDNENGVRDANETFIDFDSDGAYDSPTSDALYNGLLCNTSCSATSKSLHVWEDIVIVFSGSDADIQLTPAPLDLGGCDAGQPGTVKTAQLLVQDRNGNVMAAGTSIKLETTNGKLVTPTPVIVENTNNLPAPIDLKIQNDATTTGICSDSTTAGILTVTVTTPRGVKTIKQFDVIR